MFQGDITYTDEALYANKLSVVFEDIAAARVTMDAVREFIKNNPTVYLSTHTPLGYENLENKKVIDLDAPPATIPVGEIDLQKQAENISAQYADMYMILPNTTVLHLKTSRTTGNVRDANRARINSIKPDHLIVNQ